MNNDKFPLLVNISFIVSDIVDKFFNPWYVRLWRNIKRKYNRVLIKRNKKGTFVEYSTKTGK